MVYTLVLEASASGIEGSSPSLRTTGIQMELTEYEKDMVRKHRDAQAKSAEADAFQFNAVATAHAFMVWSKEAGLALTFSTFVNSFGYQGDDGKQMYEAVTRILEVALPK